ncbi:MAG: hypothetical protein K2J02_01820 [Malacoplasma sp.]|nr:hypothetical protein [Malacoplasma sp.]MDE7075076.1 hypothetical protein [Malacoplasma sp.]
MISKRKIMWSVVGGSAAVAAGLSVGIPINAIKQQSSTTVAFSLLESNAPDRDEFSYQIIANNQADLNLKLFEIFEEKDSISDFNDWFKNNSQYSNVSISYNNNSANFENSSFEINLTPVENASWNDGSSEVKTIPVDLTNLVKDNDKSKDVDESVYATVPTNPKYGETIEVVDFDAFESWLKAYFDSNKLTGFENVSVVYKKDSSNYEAKTFKVIATPLNGYTWSDGSKTSKEIEVSADVVQPEKPAITNDASVSNSISYSDKIEVSNDAEFNNYLIKNFSDLKLVGSFKNVSVKYINNSASFASKTFKVTATPKDNHVWTDGTTAAKTLTVTADVTVPAARIPSAWTINGVGKSSYYGNYSVDELGRLAFSDLSASYPGLLYYGVNANEPQGKININRASVIYFEIILGVNDQEAVKKQNSFENFFNFINGGTVKYEAQTESVRVYVFIDDNIGVNGYLTDNWLAYTPVNDTNGLPGQWVSNFLINTSDSITTPMSDQIIADLKATYPDWNITISDLKPINNNYGTWTYKIQFVSKDKSIVKNIIGYTFTRS